MKRTALIATVIALLGYGLWALTSPPRDTHPAAPATPAPPATSSSAMPGVAPASAATSVAPYTPATPGQVLDGNPAANTAPATAPSTVAAAPKADPSHAAPVATVTPPAALPRTLTPTQPEWSKPDAVALWFAQRYYTVDTAVDASPAMGPARAAGAATADLAMSLRTVADNGRTGAQWLALVKGNGWVKATPSMVAMADAPADTSTVAYRSVQVVEDRHADSTFGTTTHLLAIKLTKIAGQWRVAHVEGVE